MKISRLIIASFLIFTLGCSDDETDTKAPANNGSNGANNNGSSSNNDANNSDENNQSLGTWATDFNGVAQDGTSVQPYYSEANDVLSLALQGGPGTFTTLSIEIDGVGYGATGTFSAATHSMRVNAGGTGFTCFNGDNSTFAVTFQEISCTSLTVCSAQGTFTGTLECSGLGEVELDGSFQR